MSLRHGDPPVWAALGYGRGSLFLRCVAKNVAKIFIKRINKGFYTWLRTKRSGVRIFYRTGNEKTPETQYLCGLWGFSFAFSEWFKNWKLYKIGRFQTKQCGK